MPGKHADVIALFCLAAVTCLVSCSASPQERVTINVVSHKQDAQITIDADGERAVIQIVSPSGIGNAEFEITSRTLPKKIVLQFHLRGLEQLEFAYDKTVVIGSVSSAQGNVIRQYRRDSGSNEAQDVLPNSRYWMKIDLVAQAGSAKTIPLQNGTIEVEAPEDFAQGQHRRFSVQWIDFYR
jgi:hypothetical protein